MAMKPSTAAKKISQKYEEISELRKIVNAALEAKYGDVTIDHNWADGVVLVFDDGENCPISGKEVQALLDKRISIEDGLEYLKSKSI